MDYQSMGDELYAKAYTTIDAYRIRARWARGFLCAVCQRVIHGESSTTHYREYHNG